ncbi:hypothetical protein LJE14_02795 [Planktothrix agardhii 1808]|nr:hypothetical protein [Planktothrix agardhii 1809]MCB8776460.1 hypothetical protein [Planktothrix agardhii 1031]MCB8780886.1 hypothetical protein [Planktothrix agardhii 1808]
MGVKLPIFGFIASDTGRNLALNSLSEFKFCRSVCSDNQLLLKLSQFFIENLQVSF